MPINTIETRQVFQKELDKQMMEGLTSSFMDTNAGRVIYNGGSEIKIPKMSLTGLKDYSRGDGYPSGSITLEYETRTMKMDRGTSFQIDAMDVDESNFVATAGNVLGEFQRTKVIPEVDAYRYSTVQDLAKENAVIAAVTEANVYKLLIKDISAVQDIVGESTPLVCCMSGTAKGFLNASTEFSKNIEVTEFKRGEITTKVRVVNGVPILSVPSDRMYHQYIFKKGNLENLAESGFEKAEGAEMADWIILPVAAAIAVCKQDKGKIIDPDTNQKADAWFIGYRKYHDVWVKDSRIKAILPHYGKEPSWGSVDENQEEGKGGGTP